MCKAQWRRIGYARQHLHSTCTRAILWFFRSLAEKEVCLFRARRLTQGVLSPASCSPPSEGGAPCPSNERGVSCSPSLKENKTDNSPCHADRAAHSDQSPRARPVDHTSHEC